MAHHLLHGEGALPGGLADFGVELRVVEAGGGGVCGGVAEVDGGALSPVGRGETHGARLAAGVELAATELEGAKSGAGVADRRDLRVRGGVVCGCDEVYAGGDEDAAADDDGTEGTAATGYDVLCRKVDCLPHKAGVATHRVSPALLVDAQMVRAQCCTLIIVQKQAEARGMVFCCWLLRHMQCMGTGDAEPFGWRAVQIGVCASTLLV